RKTKRQPRIYHIKSGYRKHHAVLCRRDKMLGILLKERLVIYHKHKKIRYLIDVITIIAFMFILEGQGAIVLPYILVPLEVLSVIVTLAANDEESKWNRFAIALPVKKQDIVKARFGYITIILLIGT